MFACVVASSPKLADLAGQFSPLVEQVSADTIVFSIAGLGRLIGGPSQIAAAIARAGSQLGISARLAISQNASAAMLSARNISGVTVIAPGQEARVLAPIPITALPMPDDLRATIARWGIVTCGDLAALPEIGLVERFGEAGFRLRRLAMGQGTHLLDVAIPEKEYTARRQLDDPVELLEPLLFLISAQLHDLTREMRHEGKATRQIALVLELEGGAEFTREIELPFPMGDSRALLKQVQRSLEAHPPPGASIAVRITLKPAPPRIVPGGLFLPAAPEPEKLQTLLARLQTLVGPEHVGSPEILNTHRPDSWRLRSCLLEAGEPDGNGSSALRLAFRYFRPAIPARVTVQGGTPRRVISSVISSEVLEAGGPWRSSGDWWTPTAWQRDEWDVVLKDRGIYRIYLAGEQWFVDGSYD